MSEKVAEYETSISSYLVEKVSCEVENRQLKRTLELSEKKVVLLENRLNEVASQQNELESELSQSRSFR